MSLLDELRNKGWGDNGFDDEDELPISQSQNFRLPQNITRKTTARPASSKRRNKPVSTASTASTNRGFSTENFAGDKFKSATINAVGKVARWVWSVMVRGTLYGALLGASIADIFGGAVALALIFTNPSEFAGISIGSGIVATGMSMFTSGIQIFFLVTWTEKGTKQLSREEKIYMSAISLIDTLFDMTVPFWWTYGETPLNMNFVGKAPMFYLAVILFAMICLVSERFMLKVANYKG